MSILAEICHKIGWEDWCVPYGGIENPYRIVDSSEEGAMPCYKFMGEIFELSTNFHDITKILNKMISNHNRLTYEIKFTMTHDDYICQLLIKKFNMITPEEHVFTGSSNSSFEDSLYLTIRELSESSWFNSVLLVKFQ